MGQTGDELPGVFEAGGDARGVLGQLCVCEAVLEGAAHELRAEHGVETAAPVAGAAFEEVMAGAQVGFKVGDGGGEGLGAGVERGDGADDGRARGLGDEGLEGADFLFDTVGAFAVGFIDDEDVGDLHDAGFEALDVVAHAGDEDDDGDVGQAGDLDFILADADSFEEEDVLAAGLDEEGYVSGGVREPAEGAAGRHRAGVKAGIAEALLKADTVAEDGAAGEGTGGIDGDDADGFAGRAIVGGEAIDEGALAGSGRASDADADGSASSLARGPGRAAGVPEARGEHGEGFRRAVFDERDGAGQRTRVAMAEALDEAADFVGGHGY